MFQAALPVCAGICFLNHQQDEPSSQVDQVTLVATAIICTIGIGITISTSPNNILHGLAITFVPFPLRNAFSALYEAVLTHGKELIKTFASWEAFPLSAESFSFTLFLSNVAGVVLAVSAIFASHVLIAPVIALLAHEALSVGVAFPSFPVLPPQIDFFLTLYICIISVALGLYLLRVLVETLVGL